MFFFFSHAVKNLKIPDFSGINPLPEIISDPTFKAMLKYKIHLSILAIKKLNKNFQFHFSEVTVEDIYISIKQLNPRKALLVLIFRIMKTDILKANADIFSEYICEYVNEILRGDKFPLIQKHANITPVFKKDFRGSKENYCPVSILPVISKIFEIIRKQLTGFMDTLSKYQCGFSKSFSAQNCLLAILEKRKSSVNKGKIFGVLLTDLSNFSHELITAKLNANGFSLPALKLMHNYLVAQK